MTLELLFLKAGQCRTFLLMVLLGAIMALGVQLSGALHRWKAWLGMAADVLLVTAAALAVGRLILLGGEGLRGYGLLGLMIGGALYLASLGPIVEHILRMVKNFPRSRAGTSPPSAE